ncbi:hypothetical protein [Agromyces sp. GXS1127]|uniref:hypothetical protein n=1 Tax=Agromyces sp. GXS1127 TaxID=3424181 RepID=UPI003D313972
MDPITARTTLQIAPDAPLSVELVDEAYQRELWLRHPSRYPDADGRRAAESWRDTLGRARAVLVAELASPVAPAPGASVASGAAGSPRRGLSGGAIAAIVAGAVALVALLAVGGVAVFGLVRGVAETAVSEASRAAEPADPGAQADAGGDVARYESFETGYEFAAALEVYSDGRYDGECSLEFLEGCWQMALFTEAECAELEITLAYNDDAESWTAEEIETRIVPDVRADEAVPVVFGNDEREYGWVDRVTCGDGAAT